MEDVLDVYVRPYDRAVPVVCMDEKPYTGHLSLLVARNSRASDL